MADIFKVRLLRNLESPHDGTVLFALETIFPTKEMMTEITAAHERAPSPKEVRNDGNIEDKNSGQKADTLSN